MDGSETPAKARKFAADSSPRSYSTIRGTPSEIVDAPSSPVPVTSAITDDSSAIEECIEEEVEKFSIALANSRQNFTKDTFGKVRFPDKVLQALEVDRDDTLLSYLARPAVQIARRNHGHFNDHNGATVEYDALQFRAPASESAPDGYDELHLRKAIHHDIAFAGLKLNLAKRYIYRDGYIIQLSVTDAHLVILLDFIMKSNGPNEAASYHVQHRVNDMLPAREKEDENGKPYDEYVPPVPEEARPILHQIYSQPCYLREVTDLNVIKALEGLRLKCFCFVVKDEKKRQYAAYAFFSEKITEEGKLGVDVEMRAAAPRAASKTNPRTRFLPTKNRTISSETKRPAQAFAAKPIRDDAPSGPSIANPQLSFPCLENAEDRTRQLVTKRSLSGPEPSYTVGEHEKFHSDEPILLDWGGVLPSFDIAWEAWGTLNADKSNAILLHTGLSASSHAHSTKSNPKPGWWEKFIGPGAPLDTNKYFVICTNVLGGCYGSTGPSSIDPISGQHYGTSFPILTMQDMVRAQYRLLDSMGIGKLYASVGCSMGGMQSLALGVMDNERVGRIVSVSGCARSHPYSVAMRHCQRQVLMNDPNWAKTRGNYYAAIPPHTGMKLARQIATITYRSGPEWEKRFGRQRADPSKPPALCPDFLIETYLDHAGEKWCLEYDANSLLYVSKAMDLFDLGKALQDSTAERRAANADRLQGAFVDQIKQDRCTLSIPDEPYQEQESSEELMAGEASDSVKQSTPGSGPPEDLVKGLVPLRDIPTLVVGVASDILFPAWQQREIAETLRRVGNRSVSHAELGEDRSLFGHDTFLLDLEGVGGEIKRFLG
ncbi:hypothetical protein AC578_7208 [Pseudocercospora eumusae]|uniref:AB hydrolase-1 domain-containing protein n=1 Tax=Pseudocercospora eumusae TaxID=321146 RepID=A0A139HXA5_9PEZI|nr:hypothetical protein AC578_7208 [Pseudocercospora eumusae]